MREVTDSRAAVSVLLTELAPLWFAPPIPAQKVRPRPGTRPPACSAPEHRQFDYWIGAWEVENLQRNPATPEDTTLYGTRIAAAEIHPAKDSALM